MMGRLWKDILFRFGQEVSLRREEERTVLRAIIQPVLDRGEDQQVHGPLGLERLERFRYFGPADRPVDLDTVVEWKGRELRVRSAHLAGEGVCPYWWAMLYPRDEVTR